MTESPKSRDPPLELWRHPDPSVTQMWAFKEKIEKKYNVQLEDYHQLWQWSIDHIAEFWEETWHFTGILSSKDRKSGGLPPFDQVLDPKAPMFPRPEFFQGARLNFAHNLLYPTFPSSNFQLNENDPAIIYATESGHKTMSWKELRSEVEKCTKALSQIVKPNDVVAGFLGNHAWTVVAMLASTYLGAIWTAVSPDTGVAAVLDRLVQIEPKVLFADDGVEYNGKIHSSMTKLKEITKALPNLQAVVVFENVPGVDPELDADNLPKGCVEYTYSKFIEASAHLPPVPLQYFPPSHPVYILYSSGTTGKPKCIIHSSLGTLLQHKKEHQLHCDIRPGDRLFFYTTTTWMMWHWLVSGLSSGATLILYDGSPFYPHSDLTMPKFIERHKINQFGTSAKYLSILEQNNAFPTKEGVDLSSLKAIYSTGSPLAPSTFKYVYDAFPPTVNLGSITGGTDIISLFGAPCPLVPVYQGEIQCKGLGMAVCSMSPDGQPIEDSEPGDLVCTKPFICQPVGFFGKDGEQKYRASYFETFPGTWHHGDFVSFNPNTGGMVMLGRSDGILKPAGVRFGSAEIYNVLLKHFSKEVEDALCIGRRRETDTDETVVLFLKMAKGEGFSQELAEKIKVVIRKGLSARHVPGVVEECFEIPVTTNGKKVEVAVKQILCGMNVRTSASVANSECLDWYREWARTH